MSILDKIQLIKFNKKNYFPYTSKKGQIVLHHTASGGTGESIAHYWSTLKDPIATCIVIDKDGTPKQLFSSKYYAYHLGIKANVFTDLNLPILNKSLTKHSIGIELINWGALGQGNDDTFHSWANTKIPEKNVITYDAPFRECIHYELYTHDQIESVKDLLLYWNKQYGIPLNYTYETMFEVNKQALTGKAGIYSHCSYRYDKTDIHPQPDMIEMLTRISE